MSGHGDPHEEAGSDEHDEHDDDHHAAPVLEEPSTPLWLTLLGIGLFLVAGIAFVASRPDRKTTAELTASGAEPAASVAPAPVAPAPPNPALRVAAPAPNGVRPAQPAARP